MITFGLITEGITDQIVIDNILAGYFNTSDIDVNVLQPLHDETDKNRVENFGGWYRVFEYCKLSRFKEAFQNNHYIIVQIDTDCSEDTHYEVSQHENGKALSPEQLIEKVVEKFKGLIGERFYEQYKDRILFAIAVHSIECWLLPLCYPDKKRAAAIKGCFGRLNRQLEKKGKGFVIKEKDPGDYRKVSSQYCRHKTLMNLYKNNPSLKIFIEEIQRQNIVVETDDF